MKERPILFSGPMVKAILEGRKTQTRRILKGDTPRFYTLLQNDQGPFKQYHTAENIVLPLENICPYGKPGDRLWVREAWYGHKLYDSQPPREIPVNDPSIWYQEKSGDCPAPSFAGRRRPSIHMPRWMSRIDLEVTGVRVERLQEISHEDVKAEGADWERYSPGPDWPIQNVYRLLWDKIHAKPYDNMDLWEKNPWVWVVEFRRV